MHKYIAWMEDYQKVLLTEEDRTIMNQHLKNFSTKKLEWKNDPKVLEVDLRAVCNLFLKCKARGNLSQEEITGFKKDVIRMMSEFGSTAKIVPRFYIKNKKLSNTLVSTFDFFII